MNSPAPTNTISPQSPAPARVAPGPGAYASGPGCPAATYLADLQRAGLKVVAGANGRHWMGYYESMMRFPRFEMGPVPPGELHEVLRESGAKVASYLIEPGPDRPANAYLYVCSNPSLDFDCLSTKRKSVVRKGIRELEIGPITIEQVLAYGAQPFCDMHQRNGLWGANAEQFQRQFRERAMSPAHVYFGAWKGEVLAGFVSVVEVEDWAEVDAFYSRNDYLKMSVNDALIFQVLKHYMRERNCRLVSSGISSVEQTGNKEGLHFFKTKIGFEAIAVHRAFGVQRLLRPFVNRATLAGVTLALRVMPRNRILKKAAGLLHCMLDKHSSLPGDDDVVDPAADPSEAGR